MLNALYFLVFAGHEKKGNSLEWNKIQKLVSKKCAIWKMLEWRQFLGCRKIGLHIFLCNVIEFFIEGSFSSERHEHFFWLAYRLRLL